MSSKKLDFSSCAIMPILANPVTYKISKLIYEQRPHIAAAHQQHYSQLFRYLITLASYKTRNGSRNDIETKQH